MVTCTDPTRAEPCPMRGAPKLEQNAPLAPLTTIRVGGAADWLARVGSFREVTAALDWARTEGVPVAIVGKGSNLVIDDDGFRGLAINLVGRLQLISVRGRDMWCGGGASLPRAVQRAASVGLTGLEWGASIPGTAGGAVAMNAGAHSGDLASVLSWAVLCDADGRRRVSLADLDFAYRHSAVRPGEVVAAVGFHLDLGDPDAIRGRLGAFRDHRRATQPQGARTFGSVFKNPPGDSAGRLLEATGCKTLTIGQARFSSVHANFIEAAAGSSSGDVLALMREGRRRVLEAHGVELVPEVRYLHSVHGIGAPDLTEPA